MFNVGSEDKEKLRENMEEIKNLIQGRDQENEPQPASTPSSQNNEESSLGSGIEDSDFDNSQPLGSEAGSADNQLDQSETDSPDFGEQDTTPDNDSDQVPEGGFGSKLESQDNIGSSQNVSQSPQQSTDLQDNPVQKDTGNDFNSQESPPVNSNQNSQVVNSTSPQEPQQPQNHEQRSNTGQKLFLEVERFEKVKDMINEMQQLTEDIETTSNDLEDQINDERESENVAQQLLNNFDDRKREVEDVILDSEEN